MLRNKKLIIIYKKNLRKLDNQFLVTIARESKFAGYELIAGEQRFIDRVSNYFISDIVVLNLDNSRNNEFLKLCKEKSIQTIGSDKVAISLCDNLRWSSDLLNLGNIKHNFDSRCAIRKNPKVDVPFIINNGKVKLLGVFDLCKGKTMHEFSLNSIQEKQLEVIIAKIIDLFEIKNYGSILFEYDNIEKIETYVVKNIRPCPEISKDSCFSRACKNNILDVLCTTM